MPRGQWVRAGGEQGVSNPSSWSELLAAVWAAAGLVGGDVGVEFGDAHALEVLRGLALCALCCAFLGGFVPELLPEADPAASSPASRMRSQARSKSSRRECRHAPARPNPTDGANASDNTALLGYVVVSDGTTPQEGFAAGTSRRATRQTLRGA